MITDNLFDYLELSDEQKSDRTKRRATLIWTLCTDREGIFRDYGQLRMHQITGKIKDTDYPERATYLKSLTGTLEFQSIAGSEVNGSKQTHLSFLLAPQNRLTIIPKKLVHKIRDQGSLILEELMYGANHKVEVNNKLKDVESYLVVFPYVTGVQTAM